MNIDLLQRVLQQLLQLLQLHYKYTSCRSSHKLISNEDNLRIRFLQRHGNSHLDKDRFCTMARLDNLFHLEHKTRLSLHYKLNSHFCILYNDLINFITLYLNISMTFLKSSAFKENHLILYLFLCQLKLISVSLQQLHQVCTSYRWLHRLLSNEGISHSHLLQLQQNHLHHKYLVDAKEHLLLDILIHPAHRFPTIPLGKPNNHFLSLLKY